MQCQIYKRDREENPENPKLTNLDLTNGKMYKSHNIYLTE